MITRLTAFETLLLVGGGNPSNGIASALAEGIAEFDHPDYVEVIIKRRHGVSFDRDEDGNVIPIPRAFPAGIRLWAARFLSDPTWPTYSDSPDSPRNPLPTLEVERWALVESLNTGSHQRAMLPSPWFARLAGSGRWLAGDKGGHARLLLEATQAWLRLNPDTRQLLEALASRLWWDLDTLHDLAEAEKARRDALRERENLLREEGWQCSGREGNPHCLDADGDGGYCPHMHPHTREECAEYPTWDTCPGCEGVRLLAGRP